MKRPVKYYVKIVGIVLLSGLLVIIAKPAYIGILNFSGYCLEEERYLSDEEKIQIAVRREIASYPPVLVRRQSAEEEGVLRNFIVYERPDNPIYYDDIEEFYKINPNCCEVTSSGKDGHPRGIWNRLSGNTSDFVHVKYLVRYLAADGAEISHEYETFPAISNCGSTWSGI